MFLMVPKPLSGLDLTSMKISPPCSLVGLIVLPWLLHQLPYLSRPHLHRLWYLCQHHVQRL